MLDGLVATFAVPQARQAGFAALSDDRNPIHLDAEAARRTQAGAPIVFGVLTVLTALEACVGAGLDLTAFGGLRATVSSSTSTSRWTSTRSGGGRGACGST